MMLNLVELITVQPFALIAAPGAEFDEFRWNARGGGPLYDVRMLRGHACHSKDSLFDELTAALQLPLYFGRNWDALLDLLREQAGLYGEGLILCIADADHVLLHADRYGDPFWEVLKQRTTEGNPLLRIVLHIDNSTPVYEYRQMRFLERLNAVSIAPAERSLPAQ